MPLHALGAVPDTELMPLHRGRNARITSRVYRIFLDASRFSPYGETAGELKGMVATEACARGMKFEFSNAAPRSRRCWHMDTVDGYLRRQGLSLRVTDEGFQDKRYRIRLSGVHRDRYLAAMTSVTGRGKADHEFVEEILPGHSQYTKFYEIARQKLPRLNTVADVIRLFPGSEPSLAPRRREAVSIADGVVAAELLDTIGDGTVGGCPPMTFALTASFDGIRRQGQRIDGELEQHIPDGVELRFRYEGLESRAGLERFPRDNVVMACRLFESLSTKRGWIHPSRRR